VAITFEPENDPVLNGNANVESIARNLGRGFQMAGLASFQTQTRTDSVPTPDRGDATIVNNPALARKTGLAF
jgi:hypothetical protein